MPLSLIRTTTSLRKWRVLFGVSTKKEADKHSIQLRKTPKKWEPHQTSKGARLKEVSTEKKKRFRWVRNQPNHWISLARQPKTKKSVKTVKKKSAIIFYESFHTSSSIQIFLCSANKNSCPFLRLQPSWCQEKEWANWLLVQLKLVTKNLHYVSQTFYLWVVTFKCHRS